MKSLYNNLNQKGGEGAKAGEHNASKGHFDSLKKKKKASLKRSQDSRRNSFCPQEAADKLLEAIKKGHLPESDFTADVSTLSWGKSHKGHLLVRKRSDCWDLGLEGTG